MVMKFSQRCLVFGCQDFDNSILRFDMIINQNGKFRSDISGSILILNTPIIPSDFQVVQNMVKYFRGRVFDRQIYGFCH